MRVGLAALLLTACGPAQPPPTVRPTPAPTTQIEAQPRSRSQRSRVSAPRPAIDVNHVLPDLHEVLRWPLTAMSHPSLEPRYAIAAVFAQPGVGWLELCKRGIHKRTDPRHRDELEYLRGWCSAVDGDVDAACGMLVPLATSAVLGIGPSVSIDVANILANSGDADRSEHWMTKYAIRDPHILDTLSATYVEIGQEQDARVINRRAIENDISATAATRCRRLVKDVLLTAEGERALPLSQFELLATKTTAADETCVALHDALLCSLEPSRRCFSYLQAQKLPVAYHWLLKAFYAWPSGEADETSWLLVAQDARMATSVVGGDELMYAALDAAASVGGGCGFATYQTVLAIEKEMDHTRTKTPERIVALRMQCHETLWPSQP